MVLDLFMSVISKLGNYLRAECSCGQLMMIILTGSSALFAKHFDLSMEVFFGGTDKKTTQQL